MCVSSLPPTAVPQLPESRVSILGHFLQYILTLNPLRTSLLEVLECMNCFQSSPISTWSLQQMFADWPTWLGHLTHVPLEQQTSHGKGTGGAGPSQSHPAIWGPQEPVLAPAKGQQRLPQDLGETDDTLHTVSQPHTLDVPRTCPGSDPGVPCYWTGTARPWLWGRRGSPSGSAALPKAEWQAGSQIQELIPQFSSSLGHPSYFP